MSCSWFSFVWRRSARSSIELEVELWITSGVETSLPMAPDTGAAQEEYSDCTPESEPLYKPSDTVEQARS